MPAGVPPTYGRRAGWVTPIALTDFSGGLNLRDAPTELADNETPDCLNVTLDEHGGLMKRLGFASLGALPGAASNGMWSAALQLAIVQVGAILYKTADFVTYTAFKTLSTSDVVGMVEFQAQVVIVHLADGVFTYDGTTITNRSTTIKGNCAAAWQNKVFVAGDPAKPSLVTCSATGDATGWTVGTAGCAQNQLREKDDTVVTALGVGQGEDISGRPGLLVFKADSHYRINDSATLAYVTIDGSVGCAGPLAVVTNAGVTAVFCKKGVYTIDPSGTTAATNVGDKLQPLFNSAQINFAKLNLVAGGFKGDRIYFSIPFGAAATANTLTLEYHPGQGWIVPLDFAMSAYLSFTKNDAKMYGLGTTVAKAYDVLSGWSDDGAAITCRYRTHEIEPASGYVCRFRRARVFGRGVFTASVLLDMDSGVGVANALQLTGSSFIWNDPSAVWNNGLMTWGPTSYETPADVWGLGVGKSISFRFAESSTSAASGAALLGSGATPQVGAIAIYQILLEYIQLGYR